MRKPKETPKPLRLWVLVNRHGRKPYIAWSVMSQTRRDVEFYYMYWRFGTEMHKRDDVRQEFREDLKARRYTIERVTVSVAP